MGGEDAERCVRVGRDPSAQPARAGAALTNAAFSAAAALDRVARDERTALLATLTRRLNGDLALAEDALQDAFVQAAAAWPRKGVPQRPGAWLTVVAHRRAIDRIRRSQGRARQQMVMARLDDDVHHDDLDLDTEADPGDVAVPDDQLRLIFTCCHPALSFDARVALTLKCVCGFEVSQLARAFVTTESTMYQRIVRAKHKITSAGIPYRIPAADDLAPRLDAVLRVAYLIFTEGHSATSGDDGICVRLCDEALRLSALLARLLPLEAEAVGLNALVLVTDARRAARTDADGAMIRLAEQDRSRYDQAKHARGVAELDRALAMHAPGPYQIQAAIAALHTGAASAADVDWPQIAALYAALERFDPSPIVTINRAVALAEATAPAAGLVLLEALTSDDRLDDYQPFHAALAELRRRTGDVDGARRAYARAMETATNDRLRQAVGRRAAELDRQLVVDDVGPST